MSRKIRLGCVSFLNAQPLIYPLNKGLLPHPFEITMDIPSALVDGLHANKYDVALASTASLLTLGEDYSYIPDIGICSNGPVASVCIFHKGGIENISKIYLDHASRSGNTLAKIILKEHFNISTEYAEPSESTPSPDDLNDGQGCVLIGDRALAASTEHYERIDLGEAWREMTGLPFVYALWIGRKEHITDEVSIALHNSLNIGRSMIKEIIASVSELPVPAETAELYLRRHIAYDVDEDAEAGLGRFLRLAEEYI